MQFWPSMICFLSAASLSEQISHLLYDSNVNEIKQFMKDNWDALDLDDISEYALSRSCYLNDLVLLDGASDQPARTIVNNDLPLPLIYILRDGRYVWVPSQTFLINCLLQ